MVKRKVPLESAFQKKVLSYIKSRGGYAIKIHASSYQLEGEPDVVCCYKGFFCAFELKTGTDLSDLQEVKLGMIQESGGVAMKVTEIAQVEEVFDLIDTVDEGAYYDKIRRIR